MYLIILFILDQKNQVFMRSTMIHVEKIEKSLLISIIIVK